MTDDLWTTTVLQPGDERLRIPGFRLVVARGKSKGQEAVATRAELIVGTQEGVDLLLSDKAVSRHHCSLEATPRGFRLRDLGSTNGTWVAGVRLLDAFVSPGAEIVVGETTLRLQATREAVELPLYPHECFGPLLGQSTVMRQAFALLDRAAHTDATVLLLGETGCGKDLAAEALHQASPRAGGPFVVLDCSAIAESLIESELFGHEKGAFTGANDRRVGAFESAHRGTIFLDEVGELPLTLQPKLLRVLERRTVKPVGGNQSRAIDVRIVAATNRDLRAEVNRGTFREDLFFRLSVVSVRLPPLRERQGDLPLLVDRFWRESGGSGTPRPELIERLSTHQWPGNVRELRNAIERARTLGESFSLVDATAPPGDDLAIDPSIPFKVAKRRVVQRFARPYLTQLLAQTNGNVSAAARQAGLDRVHLIKLLHEYGLR